MKKWILLICTFFCCTQLSIAQRGKVTTALSFFTQGKLDKAKETIDAALKEESCTNWAKAHMAKGQIYQAIYESPSAEYKKLSADALHIAWNAFQDAIRLDRKNKFSREIRTQYQNLEIDFINQGSDHFRAQKYEQALNDFKRVLEINQLLYDKQKPDTLVIYNAAISAQKAGKNEEAINFYKKALELGYEPARTYAMLAQLLKHEGKSGEALDYLKEANAKFPEDVYLLVELVNYYLLSEQPAPAEKYLDAAIRLNPENSEYYRVKGTLYEKLNRTEEAEQIYRKALSLNQEDFISQYNLGNILLNRVIKKHEALLALENLKEYNASIDSVLSEYEEVIPYFERALELKPDDKNTVSTLSQLYFRLRNKSSDYYQKYEKMQSFLEN